MKDVGNKEEKKKGKEILPYIRLAQAICIGIFVLGLSSLFGDNIEFISTTLGIKISVFSMTTMMFGGIGAVMCEFVAKGAKKW